MFKFIILFIVSLTTGSLVIGQPCHKKYKDQLEPEALLLTCEDNYTIEKLPNGSCIMKRYYPDNKMIVELITTKTDEFKEKQGLYQQRWDDGTMVAEGKYAENLKQGKWRENKNQIGNYIDNKREGLWTTYSEGGDIIKEANYNRGELDGIEIRYDSLGAKKAQQVYELGRLLSTTIDTSFSDTEEMPRFPGCEESGLSKEELKVCSDKNLMAYIYKNLDYPNKSIEQNIQGRALIQFVIDRNGDIDDIKVLNGVSNDIKKEVIRLVTKMPRWIPGVQKGETVRVLYTLPVLFKLS